MSASENMWSALANFCVYQCPGCPFKGPIKQRMEHWKSCETTKDKPVPKTMSAFADQLDKLNAEFMRVKENAEKYKAHMESRAKLQEKMFREEEATRGTDEESMLERETTLTRLETAKAVRETLLSIAFQRVKWMAVQLVRQAKIKAMEEQKAAEASSQPLPLPSPALTTGKRKIEVDETSPVKKATNEALPKQKDAAAGGEKSSLNMDLEDGEEVGTIDVDGDLAELEAQIFGLNLQVPQCPSNPSP